MGCYQSDKDNKKNSTNWLLQAHAVFDSLYLLARLLARQFQYPASCLQASGLSIGTVPQLVGKQTRQKAERVNTVWIKKADWWSCSSGTVS